MTLKKQRWEQVEGSITRRWNANLPRTGQFSPKPALATMN